MLMEKRDPIVEPKKSKEVGILGLVGVTMVLGAAGTVVGEGVGAHMAKNHEQLIDVMSADHPHAARMETGASIPHGKSMATIALAGEGLLVAGAASAKKKKKGNKEA